MKEIRTNNYRLCKSEPTTAGTLVKNCLKVMRLSSGMDEHIVLSAWDKVTGAGCYTVNKSFVKGTLYCRMCSSVVREQLFFQKNEILKAINEEIVKNELFNGGDNYVKNLVLI